MKNSHVYVRVSDVDHPGYVADAAVLDTKTDIATKGDLLLLLQAASWIVHLESEEAIRNELGYQGCIKAAKKLAKMVEKNLKCYDRIHAWAQRCYGDTGVWNDKTIVEIDPARKYKV